MAATAAVRQDEDQRFFQLPPDTIATLWSLIKPRIVSAVERSNGRLTEKNIFDLVTAGQWQCWTFWEGHKCLAVIITRLAVESSGMKTLDAFIASGDDREKWQRIAVDRLKEFAKLEGCGLFQLMARPGWERVFTEFKKTHVLLEFEIDGR